MDEDTRIEWLRQAARKQGQSFHVASAHSADTGNYFAVDANKRIVAAWNSLEEAETAFGIEAPRDGASERNPANVGGTPNKAAMRKVPNPSGEPVSGMGQDVWFDSKTGMRWSEKEQKWF